MAGDAVAVEVKLLDVLSVVAFGIRQSEEPLLQDGILSVPQRQREAPAQVVVPEACDAVLAPPVGAASCMVVRQILPRVAVRAIVFAHRPPLALAEIGSPGAPFVRVLSGSDPAPFCGIEQCCRRL